MSEGGCDSKQETTLLALDGEDPTVTHSANGHSMWTVARNQDQYLERSILQDSNFCSHGDCNAPTSKGLPIGIIICGCGRTDGTRFDNSRTPAYFSQT